MGPFCYIYWYKRIQAMQTHWRNSVIESLRKRYLKSLKEGDGQATTELFKEAVYLGINIRIFD